MDPSLLEQFLGPSSTQLQLPVLHEDEADQLHPLISTAGFQRFSQTRKSLPGKVHTKDKVANLFAVFPLFPPPTSSSTSDIYTDRLPFMYVSAYLFQFSSSSSFSSSSFLSFSFHPMDWMFNFRVPFSSPLLLPLFVAPFSIKSSSNRFIELINYSFFLLSFSRIHTHSQTYARLKIFNNQRAQATVKRWWRTRTCLAFIDI